MSAATADQADEQQEARHRGARLSRVRVLGVLFFLVILAVALTIAEPRFLTFTNIRVVFFTAAILAIVSVAEGVVVLTGNLDLSVGSTMGLVAYVVLDLAFRVPGLEPVMVPLAVLLGAALGAFNGFLVAGLGIPSIIATLGTLSVFRGITYVYAAGGQITTSQIPSWVGNFADLTVFRVPSFVIVAVVLIALMTLIMRDLPWGRRMYAYGSNPEAALYFGLNGRRIVFSAYVVTGALTGLAGLMLGARVGTVSTQLASGWELQTLAAAVIGGISIWGGSGSLTGAALGALVLATIDNGLVLLQVDEFYRLVIQGVAIVLAVGVDAVVRGRVQRLLVRGRAA